MGLSVWNSKLVRRGDGRHVNTAGGMALVIVAGSTLKQACVDKTGAALTNPVALVNGALSFYTVDSVKAVDLYIMCPDGQFLVKTNVTRSGPNEFIVDEQNPNQLLVVPWEIADYPQATETSTGIRFLANTQILPQGLGCQVTALDATEDVDFGLLSTESGGDADGFGDAVSTATLGFAQAGYTWTTGWVSAVTLGALLRDFAAGSATDDRGAFARKSHIIDGTAVTLSITPSSGSDTAKGKIVMPYVMPIASLG